MIGFNLVFHYQNSIMLDQDENQQISVMLLWFYFYDCDIFRYLTLYDFVFVSLVVSFLIKIKARYLNDLHIFCRRNLHLVVGFAKEKDMWIANYATVTWLLTGHRCMILLLQNYVFVPRVMETGKL